MIPHANRLKTYEELEHEVKFCNWKIDEMRERLVLLSKTHNDLVVDMDHIKQLRDRLLDIMRHWPKLNDIINTPEERNNEDAVQDKPEV